MGPPPVVINGGKPFKFIIPSNLGKKTGEYLSKYGLTFKAVTHAGSAESDERPTCPICRQPNVNKEVCNICKCPVCRRIRKQKGMETEKCLSCDPNGRRRLASSKMKQRLLNAEVGEDSH